MVLEGGHPGHLYLSNHAVFYQANTFERLTPFYQHYEYPQWSPVNSTDLVVGGSTLNSSQSLFLTSPGADSDNFDPTVVDLSPSSRTGVGFDWTLKPILTVTSEISVDDESGASVIPYERAIFTVKITNNTDVPVEDMIVRLSPFTDSADPHEIPFRFENRVPGNPLLSYDGPTNTITTNLANNGVTLDPHGDITLRFYGHSKLSGQPEITIHATSANHNIDFQTTTAVNVDVTHLELLGADAAYAALIFWATFNETSEGNEFLHDPENLENCFQAGWAVPDAADVMWVIRKDNPTVARCRDLIYMDIQVTLNGMLNYERDLDTAAYSYFTVNFKGSLGNNPPADKPLIYYQGVAGDPYTGSNRLWMAPQCWPLGSDFGITNIQNPPGFPLDRIGYKVVLDPAQTIAELPPNFDQNRASAVIGWLSAYLECYMSDGTGGNAKQSWQYAFYQQVYLGTQSQEGLITQVFKDFYANCPALVDPNNPDSYLNCDPANGAVGRVSAQTPQGDTITSPVNTCQGDTPAQVLSSGIDFLSSFQQEMAAIGSPAYTGGVFPPNGYHPGHPTILLPVVFFDRKQQNTIYSVVSCHWEIISYPQADRYTLQLPSISKEE